MSGENKKVRSRKQKPSKLLHWLNTEGRRYCAVALCASLIMGNLGQFASIAGDDKESDFEFEMSRLSIYEALQEAVADGNTVDTDFRFSGIDTESYEMLMESDGTLYELFPEIKGGGKHVDLRVFTRLTGDIALDGTYQIDGEEEVIFMLNNNLDAEKTAAIIVDDKKTEPIVLTPKSAIVVSDEDDPYVSASEFTQENESEEQEIILEPTEAVDESEAADDTEVSVVEDEAEDETDEAAEDSVDEIVIENDEDDDSNNIEEVDVEIEAAASISSHKVYRVASSATPSDAEKEEIATPSNATDSNADLTELDGQTYEAVLMDGTATTAFVTTLEDLDVSNLLVLMASPANAGKMHTAEVDGVIVKAWVNNGVLPDDAELVVTKLDEENNAEQYQTAVEALEQSGTQYGGMMALDISFRTEGGTGEEIEPDGNVQVSIEMKKEALPEDVAPEMMAVQHLKEVENGVEVQTVADTTVDTNGTVEEKEDAKIEAAFEVESFSTFTITWTKDGWSNYFSVTVHYVNTNGEEIEANNAVSQTIENGQTITFADYSDRVATGLVYNGAYYGAYNGRKVTSVTAKKETKYIASWSYDERSLIFDMVSGNDLTLTYDRWANKVVTADVYLVYETKTITPPSEIIQERELTRSKTATKVLNVDDTYDLELSISGAVGSSSDKVPVDILLILDTSGSMEYKIDDDTTAQSPNRRIDKVASAVSSLTASIGNNKNIDVRYSVVTFAGNGKPQYKDNYDYGTTKTLVNWTDSATTVNTSISAVTPVGGTNYQAGIEKGKSQLNSARSNAQKVVLFLTDGLPTLRGTTSVTQSGSGQDDNSGYNQKAAVEEIKGMNCNAFYAIGVGPDFKNTSGSSSGITNLQGLCNNVGSTNNLKITKAWYSATDTSSLNNAFAAIASDVNYILCSKVTVLDTLSNMVDFETTSATTSGTPNTDLKIKITDKDGKTLSEGKGSCLLSKTEQNPATTVSAEYVAESKEIRLVFPAEYKLEAGWTYSVTATIKANENAYQAYRDNSGYTDTGDADTGTHSGEVGFKSNAEAYVEYTYNDEGHKKYFADPVVQIKPGELVIKKEITGFDLTKEGEKIEALLATLAFNVKLNWAENTKNEEFIVSAAKMEQASVGNKLILEYKKSGLSPDTKYEITEMNADINGYFRTTTITGGTASKDTVTGTVARGEIKTVTYTNAYEPALKLIVKKIVKGNMGDVDETFTFTPTVMRNNTRITADVCKGLDANGQFTLRDFENHSETFEISNLKRGDVVTIQEMGAESYKTTLVIDGGGESGEVKPKIYATGDSGIRVDTEVTFVNTKDTKIDTGILLDSMPYVVILAAVAAGAAFYFIRKKKEDEDDFE